MRYFSILIGLLLLGCAKDQNKNPIDIALQSEASPIKNVMQHLDKHEIQIKLSTITRLGDSVIFEDFGFQVNDSLYYYPASSVKFPGAILALEKLHADGLYSLDTPFYVEGDTLTTTFRHEITDIFAVSSNDTYNRLFEFLGKDNMNQRMKDLGLPSRFSHRLSTDNAYDLTTKPFIFLESDSTLTTTEAIINSPIEALKLDNIIKGKGYYANDELVHEPMDFSEKNYLPISSIHDIMKRIIFPITYPKEKRFLLSEGDREFLINTMAIVPKDAGYDPVEYYDGYGKFFMFGDTKESIPDHIKIHNKVGYAYGYLTDCAYIIDALNNIEYILTATIHVNEDGIFNDDIYEYDNIGLPFLAELGRNIHQQLINQ